MEFDAYPYGRVAAIYDELARLYSRDRIGRSKRHALALMAPGDEALFAGVGRGEEAVEAASRGVRVSAIDLSPEMLRRFAARLKEAGVEAELIEGDVFGHASTRQYDVVVAHYFLNLFEEKRAAAMLDGLIALVRPGGCLVIADFAIPDAGLFARLLTAAYYRLANGVAWALGFCALHPILEYERLLLARGMRVRSVTRFPISKLLGRSSPAFVSIAAERVGPRTGD